jgi:type IV secretion system protein VirB9
MRENDYRILSCLDRASGQIRHISPGEPLRTPAARGEHSHDAPPLIRLNSVCAGLLAAAPAVITAAAIVRPTAPAVDRVAAANQAATREPDRQGFLNAMLVYPYAEGALHRVYSAPERAGD